MVRFFVLVKTGKPETRISSYDESSRTYSIEVHARPLEGEANKELVKFLKKYFKKEVRIVSGLQSKKKIIEILY